MAHYAIIDENNIVVNVIVGSDEDDENNYETIYGEFHNKLCKRTSYNTLCNKHLEGGMPFRKNYAGIGFSYDSNRDAFIPPKPYPSWILNENTCCWDAPVPRPTGTHRYTWDETNQTWLDLTSLEYEVN